MIEHALAYARAGLPVLPLLPRGKAPACAHGKDDATTDVDRITRWWSQRPECNIGMRPPRGLVVLDVDTQHGGPGTLAALFDRYGSLPATWMARTGQGGQHIWLRAEGPCRGTLGLGIDVKTHSGYLVVPPSVHPNGSRYEWLNSNPIAYAPAWLRSLIAPAKPRVVTPAGRSASGSGLVNAVRNAPQGQRNRVLYWAACRAAEQNALGQLRAELAAAAMDNGLPASEVENTLNSAQSKESDA